MSITQFFQFVQELDDFLSFNLLALFLICVTLNKMEERL